MIKPEEAPDVVRSKYTDGALGGYPNFSLARRVSHRSNGVKAMTSARISPLFKSTVTKFGGFTEVCVRSMFPFANTPKALFTSRISSVYRAQSPAIKVGILKLASHCLTWALEYSVLFGLVTLMLMHGNVRPWITISNSAAHTREGYMLYEKTWDVVKADTGACVDEVLFWVEAAGLFGLPKRLTKKEVTDDMNIWVGNSKPNRFPNDRELFEYNLKNSPFSAGGPKEPFKDWFYVAANWERTGAADFGYIEFDDTRIKATKNILLYSKNIDEVYRQLLQQLESSEKVFIDVIQKVENKLKPRTAVADAFVNFVTTLYLFGDYTARNQDPGNVLKETKEQTMTRYLTRLEVLMGNYCVNWDWSGFDRWPELHHVIMTIYPLLSGLDLTYCKDILERWIAMRGRFWVRVKEGGEIWTRPVLGGITSGDYLTNYMDTIYNRAAVLTAQAISNTQIISYDLKGDDIMAIFPDYNQALKWIETMQNANIEAKVDIFGISLGRGEFLRQMMDSAEHVVVGYPNRVVWWLTKDWNPPSSNDSSRLSKLSSGIFKVKDRMGKLPSPLSKVILEEVQNFSIETNYPESVITIPGSFGGLGGVSELWDGSYVSFNNRVRFFKYNRKPLLNVSVPTQTSDMISARLAKYNLQVDREASNLIGKNDFTSKVSLNHFSRSQRTFIKGIVAPKNYAINKPIAAALPQGLPAKIREIVRAFDAGFKFNNPLCGYYAAVAPELRAVNEYKLVNPSYTVLKHFQTSRPSLFRAIKHLEYAGLPRKTALDYLVFSKTPLIRMRCSEFAYSWFSDIYAYFFPYCWSRSLKSYASKLYQLNTILDDAVSLSEVNRLVRT